MAYGILIGVGATMLVGAFAWLIWNNGQLARRVQVLEQSGRKRLPYDAMKFAENTAAGLVLAEQELETQLNAVRNAKAWNTKLLNLGIKPMPETTVEDQL